MKDISNINALKATRLSVDFKRRPSPLVRDIDAAKSRQLSPIQPILSSALCRRRAEIRRIRDSQSISQIRHTRNFEEEYRHDILHYMHEMEQSTKSSSSLLDHQPEISWPMRLCLVNFLVEVHFEFRLRPETLYLANNIVDRYISRRIVYKEHYELLGCAALWVASKFEDPGDRVPTLDDLSQSCRGTYSKAAFIKMECYILKTIQWEIGHPTPETWLCVACTKSGLMEDSKTQHIARFLMEITLFHREFVDFVSSTIATGALILARYICGKQCRPSDETDEALRVAELLDTRLASSWQEVSKVLVEKYSYAYYSNASAHVLQFFREGRRFVRQPLPTDVPPTAPPAAVR